MDPSYRLFDKRSVASAISKAGSSTAQVPDTLTVHQLAIWVSTTCLPGGALQFGRNPAIWKKSVIMPILNAGKPRDQGRSYRPISLLCPAVKILERLLLPPIMEALGICPSQYASKSRHSTISAQLPISARVVSGFDQQKPPSRTIAIAVDISKAIDTCFSPPPHRDDPLFPIPAQFGEEARDRPPRQEDLLALSSAPLAFPPGAGRGPTGIHHLSSSLQPLCDELPNPRFRHDVLRRRLHAARLSSQHRGSWGESKPTMLLFGEVASKWSNWPLLPRNPVWHCSPPTPTNNDPTLTCELVTRWLRWTEPLKSWASCWTTISPRPSC